MDLNDAFHQSQTDSRAIAFYIQFIEQAKDSIIMFDSNTDAIIPYIQYWLAIFHSVQSNLNVCLLLVSHKLAGIIDQILQHFKQTLSITKHSRQICINVNGNTSFHDLSLHQLNCIVRQLTKSDADRFVLEPPHPRKFKKVIQKHLHL